MPNTKKLQMTKEFAQEVVNAIVSQSKSVDQIAVHTDSLIVIANVLNEIKHAQFDTNRFLDEINKTLDRMVDSNQHNLQDIVDAIRSK